MRLSKWSMPILTIALITMAGGGLLAANATAPGAAKDPSDPPATPIQPPSPEEMQAETRAPKRGLVMQARGVWKDPPPDGGALPPQTPMSPWYPPYDAGAERYPDTWRPVYRGPRDFDRPRRTGWLESFCPLPKRRHAWPVQDSYPQQTGRLDQQRDRGAFMSRPPFVYWAPTAR